MTWYLFQWLLLMAITIVVLFFAYRPSGDFKSFVRNRVRAWGFFALQAVIAISLSQSWVVITLYGLGLFAMAFSLYRILSFSAEVKRYGLEATVRRFAFNRVFGVTRSPHQYDWLDLHRAMRRHLGETIRVIPEVNDAITDAIGELTLYGAMRITLR